MNNTRGVMWLYQNWWKSTLFLAIYLFLFLNIYLKDSNYPVYLIWIQFVVYLIHQFEEYVFPGGFVSFFNLKILKSKDGDFPLNNKASFWINIPIIFVAYPISAILADTLNLSIGLWTVYFSVINALSHVGMFFKVKYNPGLLASIVLNIPVGLYTIYFFCTESPLSGYSHLIGFGIGAVLQLIVMGFGFFYLKPKIKNKTNKNGFEA